MNKEEIKKIVLDYINENGSASYAELQWLFDQHGYAPRGHRFVDLGHRLG